MFNVSCLKALLVNKKVISVCCLLAGAGAFLYCNQPFEVKVYTHLERTDPEEYRYVYKWGFWQFFHDEKLMCRGFDVSSDNINLKITRILMEMEEEEDLGSYMFIFENKSLTTSLWEERYHDPRRDFRYPPGQNECAAAYYYCI